MDKKDLEKVRVALSLIEELKAKASELLCHGAETSEPLTVEGLTVDLGEIRDELFEIEDYLAHLELYIGRLAGTYDEDGNDLS